MCKVCGKHDKLVCAAVLLSIELTDGVKFTKVRYPDDEHRDRSEIDLLAESSTITMAMEHTLVESFPEQIKDGIWFVDLFLPLESQLTGKLPHGDFRLSAAPGAVRGATEGEKIRTQVYSWIVEKAPILSLGKPPNHRIIGGPPELPLEITLTRYRGSIDRLNIARALPDDIDMLRVESIKTALKKKLPKLSKAKVGSTKSIFVMESNDMANSAPILAEFLGAAVRADDDMPDLIYAVETGFDKEWFVYKVTRADQCFIQDDPIIIEQGRAFGFLSALCSS